MKTRGFAHRIDIEAPPPKVWTAMCGPTLAALWLGRDARIRPQQGGTWSATLAPGLAREGLIDVFDPPRRLRLIYLQPPYLPPTESTVVDDVMLEATEGHTVVRLLCSGMPETPEWTAHYLKVRAAAERALARLKVLVEQRERMGAAKSPAS
jgi:uncharacterized protein YndB with AHSA1/START domain